MSTLSHNQKSSARRSVRVASLFPGVAQAVRYGLRGLVHPALARAVHPAEQLGAVAHVPRGAGTGPVVRPGFRV